MNLLTLCKKITGSTYRLLPEDHKLGTRLVCPEYSKSAQEVKTYPFLSQDRLFALCWNIDTSSVLNATLCPSPEPFYYQHRFLSGEKTQLHTHEYIELAYVVRGEFKQKILDKDITFGEGELCLIDKNCLHQDYLMDSNAVILFLGIENDMFTEIMDENVSTQKIIAFLQTALTKQKDLQQYLHFRPSAEVKEEMEECLYLLLSELHNSRVGSSYICKGLLLRIFQILSSKYEFSLSKEQQKTMNWIIFEEICDFIHKNYSTVTVQQLVDTFHFQEDYFNRLFKKKTGMTYSAYVQDVRLSRAKKMLCSTDKSISEIAELIGYHNKGYFYKIFQKKYNMTPQQYRMSNK
ncbi:MAG: helix-turn-helix domain-containing protein [Roseburia sp.]|nr:helix-turn-helix domain-containing protein [Roseburia sp.]